MPKSRLTSCAKNIFLTVFGTLILAFGTAVFIIPFDLVVGGMSGFAIVLHKLFGAISVDLAIALMTWGTFALGAAVLGGEFALKTLVSTVIYPVAIALFSKLCSPEVLNGIFYLKGSPHGDIALLISALFGGVLIGTSCAVTFVGGGSTGGIDVLAFILCRFFKRMKSSTAIFCLDTSAVLLGLIVINDLVLTLLGIISAFVSALAVDKIFVGGQKAYTAQIISDNSAQISRAIIERLGRTATVSEVIGGYSGLKKQMLTVSFTVSQYAELRDIIGSTDKSAFVTVHETHEINGEGWTRPSNQKTV